MDGPSLLLHNDRGEAAGVLDVDGLDVGVELLLGVLLVVTAAGDADAQAVGDALDTLLPDSLVQLGVQADIGGALQKKVLVHMFHSTAKIVPLSRISRGCLARSLRHSSQVRPRQSLSRSGLRG